MSSCPHCYVGLCKRHKLQDHGRREQNLMASKSELQKKLFESLVKPQLVKLDQQMKANSVENVNKYKEVCGRRRKGIGLCPRGALHRTRKGRECDAALPVSKLATIISELTGLTVLHP
jgi:hypothetical protein